MSGFVVSTRPRKSLLISSLDSIRLSFVSGTVQICISSPPIRTARYTKPLEPSSRPSFPGSTIPVRAKGRGGAFVNGVFLSFFRVIIIIIINCFFFNNHHTSPRTTSRHREYHYYYYYQTRRCLSFSFSLSLSSRVVNDENSLSVFFVAFFLSRKNQREVSKKKPRSYV